MLFSPVLTEAGARIYQPERYDGIDEAAMLTALHIYPRVGPWAAAFPVLIALSCLFTKQHYLIDIPAGAALGWFTFKLFTLVA